MKKLYLVILLAFLFNGNAFSQLLCNIYYTADTSTNIYTFSYAQSGVNNVVQWNFGDGNVGFGQTVMHQYTTNGVFVVCATEVDTSTMTNVCQACVTINTSSINNCFFSFTEVTPGNNSLLQFQSYVTPSSASVFWDFGDGSSGAGFFINHQYTAPGTYTACMTSINGIDTCHTCSAITVTSFPTGSCTFSATPNVFHANVINFSTTPIASNVAITWDFGDSTGGFGANTSHTYLHAGTYLVCMYEVDASTGLDLCHICQTVYVGVTPVCGFTASPSATLQNTFDFTGYIADSTNIASWDFGDGTTGIGLNISHTYAVPGTYNICMLEVDTNPLTTMCQSCSAITIGNPGCDANFTVVPFALDAYFIDFSSGYSSATTYTWDFGDGSPLSTLRFPSHTYSTPGTYNACLYLNTGFCADTMCQTLTVDTTIISPMFCQAYYVFTQLSPYQLAVVNLSSGTNLSFLWDFGDGTSSTAAYPIHTYANHGSYTLCLTVADGSGCTSTYCDTLTVDSTGLIIYRSMTAGFTINVVAPNELNSVKDLTTDFSGHIFPNPATDRLYIESAQTLGNEVSFTIRSITGSKLLNGSLNQRSPEITIGELPQGVYLLELRNEKNEVSFARFIKQ